MTTQTIPVELTRPGPLPVVYATAGDIYSRRIALQLYSSGAPCTPPEGTTCLIGWRRSDGTAGHYDTITESDGQSTHNAWQLEGSTLTIELSDKVCARPGDTAVNVALMGADGSRLHTWELICRVERGAVADSEDASQPSESATEAANRAEAAAAEAKESAANLEDTVKRAEAAAERSEAVADELENIVKDGPVVSVNGKTGRVQLSASDIPFDNAGTPFVSTTVQDAIEELLGIGGGGGTASSTITVTAPAGAVVTVSKGDKSYTQTVGEDGAALSFKVLETGEWTVSAVLNGEVDKRTVNVAEAGGSYSVELPFSSFEAYIKVTTADGATVKASKGDSVVTDTAAGGIVTLTVSEAGQWTVSATYKDGVAQSATVYAGNDGQTYTAEAKFCTLTVTAPAGSSVEIQNGDTTLSGTADSGSIKFWLPNTGTWTVTATLDGQTATGSVDCAAYQDYSIELAYFSATIKATAVQGATVKAILDDYTVSAEAGGDGTASLTVAKAGSYTVSATYSNAGSNTKSVQVSDSGQEYTVSVEFITLTVTAPEGSTITVKNGAATLSETGGTVKFYLPHTGTWTVTAELNGESARSEVQATEYKDYDVVLSYVSAILSENSWGTIKKVSAAGNAGNYWDDGDTKPVVLNGSLQGVSFDNESVNAFIIGIGHNPNYEDSKTIHFQLGKIGTKLVAFCDSNVGSSGHTSGFIMVSDGSPAWVWSWMSVIVLRPADDPISDDSTRFAKLLPDDLKKVMKSVKKYTAVSSSITSRDEFITLMSEFELFGNTKYSNSVEENYQSQYSYYKSGNSKRFYNHSKTSNLVTAWLRSPSIYGTAQKSFCAVDDTGSAYYRDGDTSLGIAPIFFV